MTSIRILRLASGGDGVGRLADGRTVFVPRTAPGDLVEPADVRIYPRFARATLGRLLESSPDRVVPPCSHYVADECGGCQWQHLAVPAQQIARRGIVGDALRRIAKRDVPDPELTPAANPFDYRVKVTLAASGAGGPIGLHPYGRPTEIFDLRHCPIARAGLMELWAAVRECRSLLPERTEHLVLRQDRAGERHLLVRTGTGAAWNGEALQHTLARLGCVATVWWHESDGRWRAMADTSAATATATATAVTAFEQIHPEMGDRVRAAAVAALGDPAGRLVWDLYAGIGETTHLLAHAGAVVESVEADGEAVEAARRRVPGATIHRGRVEDHLSRMRWPELVITNPPRAGMHERVTAALARLGPERIVYISCDPATLARDLTRLPEYRLAGVHAFDLFPQTAHVETVATLERQ